MTFRIRGLDPESFRHLFGQQESALTAEGAIRVVTDARSGLPDRIELRDTEPGETALLVNYLHQPAATPYRASHAIFLREGAESAYDGVGVIPPALRTRTLSLRAFDATGMMVEAELVEGAAAETLIATMLTKTRTAYIHAHFARWGCFAARIDRP